MNTKLIDADALYEQIAKKEELARQRVLDTPSRMPNGDLNPSAIRYTAQLDERTQMKYMIADAPTVDAEPQWIPCNERLPEDDRSKVVTLANGNAEVGYYSNGDWWCIGDTFTLENPTVIAWMPLPKPYEVEE